MAQSILYNTPAFDAMFGHTLTFTNSGNQSFKNRVVINNNTTNVTVYDKTITTNKLTHTIAPESLTNGICYNAVVTTFDINGVESSQSNTIIFYCYTTPTLSFSNIIANQVIRNSGFTAELTYTQPEGEKLNEYKVILYDNGKQQIYATNVLRSSSSLTGTIRGLQDNTQYYIKATGQTISGMDMETDFIPISVEYINPLAYNIVKPENSPNDGCIKVASNFTLIEGISNPTNPIFINNSEVDTRTSGSYVKFNKGFTINKDFKISLIGRNPINSQIVITLSNGTDKIEIQYLEGIFHGETVSKSCYVLRAHNAITFDQINTGYFATPSTSTYTTLTITRKNNLFDLEVG